MHLFVLAAMMIHWNNFAWFIKYSKKSPLVSKHLKNLHGYFYGNIKETKI